MARTKQKATNKHVTKKKIPGWKSYFLESLEGDLDDFVHNGMELRSDELVDEFEDEYLDGEKATTKEWGIVEDIQDTVIKLNKVSSKFIDHLYDLEESESTGLLRRRSPSRSRSSKGSWKMNLLADLEYSLDDFGHNGYDIDTDIIKQAKNSADDSDATISEKDMKMLHEMEKEAKTINEYIKKYLKLMDEMEKSR
jgi:hypothetical protein